MKLLFCVVFYSFMDYVCYGISQDEHHNVGWGYRLFQVVFMWIPVMLWLDTWGERLEFLWLWWCFVMDWLYYGFSALPFKKLWWEFDDWNDTLRDFGNGITHAWWTPAGLAGLYLVGKETKDEPIPVRVLVWQSGGGVGIIFLLTSTA